MSKVNANVLKGTKKSDLLVYQLATVLRAWFLMEKESVNAKTDFTLIRRWESVCMVNLALQIAFMVQMAIASVIQVFIVIRLEIVKAVEAENSGMAISVFICVE